MMAMLTFPLFLFINFLHFYTINTLPTMQDPSKFEGDMVLTVAQMMRHRYGINPRVPLAAIHTDLWPTTIPYVIEKRLAKYKRAVKAINEAIAKIQRKTCLRFVKRTTQKGYMNFMSDGITCSAHVGNFNTKMDVSLALAGGCWEKRIAIHEICHSLGFHHEQSRPDRNYYIKINKENILKDMEYNFEMEHYSNIDSLNVPYDLQSIMHYSRFLFSKDDNKPTIDAVDPTKNHLIGISTSLSPLDTLQLNLLYKCPGYTRPPGTLPPISTDPVITVPITLPPSKGWLSFDIISQGADDPAIFPWIPKGSASIQFAGKEWSPAKQGHNVIGIDMNTGVVSVKNFDTSQVYLAGIELKSFLSDLSDNSIVIMAVQEDGANFWFQAKGYMKKTIKGYQDVTIMYQSSYALLGYKGNTQKTWVQQEHHPRSRGPSRIRANIYTAYRIPDSCKTKRRC